MHKARRLEISVVMNPTHGCCSPCEYDCIGLVHVQRIPDSFNAEYIITIEI